jgi:hypothetical protein
VSTSRSALTGTSFGKLTRLLLQHTYITHKRERIIMQAGKTTSNELFTVTFEHQRETKGAVVYRELDEDGVQVDSNADACVGSLYVRKSALPEGEAPARIVAAFAVA